MNISYIQDYCAIGDWTITRPNNTATLDSLADNLLISISVIQVIISIFGAFGNGLSLCVLLCDKSLQTIPNAYIGHMATLDLITCLTIIPSSVVQSLTGKRLDEKPCKAFGKCLLSIINVESGINYAIITYMQYSRS